MFPPSVDRLRGGLLVLAISEGKYPRGPGVTVIPVLGPGEGVPLAGPAGLSGLAVTTAVGADIVVIS